MDNDSGSSYHLRCFPVNEGIIYHAIIEIKVV